MNTPVYKPFDRFSFDDKACYLTGKPASLHPVFPDWILREYGLGEKLFKFLDENIVTYDEIKMPVSDEAELAFSKIDSEIKAAFSLGYQAVSALNELTLFQWIGKLVYGTIYNEIRTGIKQQLASGEPFNFSQSLAAKFSNFHLMLQSIVRPVEFEGILPWSIKVIKLTAGDEPFSYRDEINTLVFSLKLKDFGIIACLQDNGESLNYHKNILDKIQNKPLHPIQFEEICARFFYSAYLFNRLPEFTVFQTDEAVFIESMPLRISSKPIYDVWQVKTYGQVLENFWKPWGLLLFEIIKNPDRPMSFLEDEEGNVISPENLNLK